MPSSPGSSITCIGGRKTDPTSPRIKSVALLGTKYDTVRGEILDNPGFGHKDMYGHLGDPRNAAIFLFNHLPQTNQNLKQLFSYQ